MTQLDVPNISFTHYLDLLKRRTWHVVIVSVLGLVTGGTVAMLIPRYYVATTVVQINRPVLDPKLGTPADPMEQVVGAAAITVPAGVRQAVRELGWHEALSGDEDSRLRFVEAVADRVRVEDIGPFGDRRQIVRIQIRYSDTDGHRAKEMAEALRELWLKDFVLGMKSKAEEEIAAVAEDKRTLQEEVNRARSSVEAFEEQHHINPQDWRDERVNGQLSVLSTEIRNLESQFAANEREMLALRRQVQLLKEELQKTPPNRPVDLEAAAPALRDEYARLTATVFYATKTLKNITQAHEDWDDAKQTLLQAQSDLAELEKTAGGSSMSMPNPRYEALEKMIRDLESRLAVGQAMRKDFEDGLVRMRAERDELPAIYRQYAERRLHLETLLGQVRKKVEELEDKNQMMRRIHTERPYDILHPAHVPSRPTEPNPVLLALVGCVVGLGAAIALVLLIDFLQMTFKSVADVEGVLGLPVLGTLSYLESEQEVQRVRARRARMTVFASAFLVLFLTVVTIYYVAPTMLPTVVTEVLDQILGGR